MALVLITAPAAEPLSTAEAKSHLKVDATDEDGLIDNYVKAARQIAEEFLRRALITQTWELVLDAFPDKGWLELPLPPLGSVTSVKYTPDGGAETTFAATNYIVDTSSEPGRIVLATNKDWPSDTLQAANGVKVRYVAGYGASASSIPEAVRQGIRLLLGHLFENREGVVTGGAATELPQGVEYLWWPFRALQMR